MRLNNLKATISSYDSYLETETFKQTLNGVTNTLTRTRRIRSTITKYEGANENVAKAKAKELEDAGATNVSFNDTTPGEYVVYGTMKETGAWSEWS